MEFRPDMYSWNVLSNEMIFSIRFIRLKTKVEELVSQRTEEKANRRVRPRERHFLVLEAANWPYCDNYERKLFPCIERGRSNPRPKFRDRAYVIRLILSNLIRKRSKALSSLLSPAIKFPLIRLSCPLVANYYFVFFYSRTSLSTSFTRLHVSIPILLLYI